MPATPAGLADLVARIERQQDAVGRFSAEGPRLTAEDAQLGAFS